MKLLQDFENFVEEEVNLNKSRIETLVQRVEAIEGFLQESDWGPIIQSISAQGSWAHKTIIKPPGEQGFDADLYQRSLIETP